MRHLYDLIVFHGAPQVFLAVGLVAVFQPDGDEVTAAVGQDAAHLLVNVVEAEVQVNLRFTRSLYSFMNGRTNR
jgi:hypothetical protein